MFERFTDRARQVVVVAQEEARRFGHDYVGTEHLLLGLVKERDGVAGRVLVRMGIELDQVRETVEERVGDGGGAPAGHLPFTGPAKTALEMALREALELRHNYIGTEHILLGLVREGEGLAAQVLAGFGVEAEAVRATVVELLSGHAVQAKPVAPLGPNCPVCRSPVEGRLGWKDMSATAEGGGDIQTVRVVFCRSCSSALMVSGQ